MMNQISKSLVYAVADANFIANGVICQFTKNESIEACAHEVVTCIHASAIKELVSCLVRVFGLAKTARALRKAGMSTDIMLAYLGVSIEHIELV